MPPDHKIQRCIQYNKMNCVTVNTAVPILWNKWDCISFSDGQRYPKCSLDWEGRKLHLTCRSHISSVIIESALQQIASKSQRLHDLLWWFKASTYSVSPTWMQLHLLICQSFSQVFPNICKQYLGQSQGDSRSKCSLLRLLEINFLLLQRLHWSCFKQYLLD